MSDDCISRHKAIVAITACDGKSAQIEALEKLPSVTPKPIITNKSAVFWLENITEKYLKGDTFEDRQMKKSINKAIKTLSKEPKTGHWIVDGSVDCYLDRVKCHCSECGKKKEFPANYDHIKKELSISYKYPEFIDNYCSNCGACMKDCRTLDEFIEDSKESEEQA